MNTSPKSLSNGYQKIVIHGFTIFVEQVEDTYNIYNEHIHLIETISAPMEGLELIDELHKCVIRNPDFISI